MKKEIVQTIKTVALAAILGVGIQFAFADWTSAPSNPPLGNVDAPINVSSIPQAKLGSLQLNKSTTGPVAAVGLTVWGNSSTPVRFIDNTPGDDAGKVLTSDANGYASWQLPASGGTPASQAPTGAYNKIYNTPGTYTFTKPYGVINITAEVAGAGGGRWRAGTTVSACYDGGSGAYGRGSYATPIATTTYTVVVGAGTPGGSAGSAGASSVGTLITANGGENAAAASSGKDSGTAAGAQLVLGGRGGSGRLCSDRDINYLNSEAGEDGWVIIGY